MTTTFYIASKLENAPRVRDLRDHLLAAGWEITYDWTVHGSVRGPDMPRERIADVADREVNGVLDADVLIVLLPGGRGTHTELGVALAFEIGDDFRVVLWSATPDVDFGTTEATSAFYHHPGVEHRSDPDMESLARWLVASSAGDAS